MGREGLKLHTGQKVSRQGGGICTVLSFLSESATHKSQHELYIIIATAD